MAKNTGSNAKWGEAPKSTWIDISIPFRNNMVHWPSDPVPHVKRLKDRNAGDDTTLTEMQWIDHVGTHVDAPLHFIKNGKTIDKMPLNATIGRTRVIEIKNPISITLKELVPHGIRRGERILFKTQNSVKCYKSDAFVEDYVYFDTDVAQYLADKGVRVVGIDYLSIGKYGDRESLRETHRILLDSGVYIIEGINLAKVKAGRYELLCLPILLENGDAASARAILRPA